MGRSQREAGHQTIEGLQSPARQLAGSRRGGEPAISVVADFVDGQQAKVFYAVYVLAEPNATKFLVRLPAGEFDKFRQQLDGIIYSYRMK